MNVISYILMNIHIQANECTIKSWFAKSSKLLQHPKNKAKDFLSLNIWLYMMLQNKYF